MENNFTTGVPQGESNGSVFPDQYGSVFPDQSCHYVQSMPWTYVPYPTKSAREQVQDEILIKLAEAIEGNDLKKARQLIELAKTLKEL
jgi:hypothetical protein